MFFLAGGLTLLGEIVFVIFGSGEVQPWAMVDDNDDDNRQIDDIKKDDIEKIPESYSYKDGGDVQDGRKDVIDCGIFESETKTEGTANPAYSNF